MKKIEFYFDLIGYYLEYAKKIISIVRNVISEFPSFSPPKEESTNSSDSEPSEQK